ncbi:MAG: hydrolase [Elusimicrobia bacterium]|nr:hydrolase [Elusimicrobiota bacterium]
MIQKTMPFTPFHFGPSACVALPLRRYLDFSVFVLVSVVIDVEPLYVMAYNPHYPLHGYAHTFVGSALIGAVFGWLLYRLRGPMRRVMAKLRIAYEPSLPQAIFSGVLGAWFHVFLDSMLYGDIRPLYPLAWNPLLGFVGFREMYIGCAVACIPAVGLYLYYAARYVSRK